MIVLQGDGLSMVVSAVPRVVRQACRAFRVARWPAPVLDSCAAGLCVTVSLSGGTLRVHVVGDIDLATAPRLKAMLDLSRLEDVYRLSWTCLE